MSAENYEPTYREIDVDETLSDHENRISDNERRWLLAKGAFVALATIQGTNVAIDAVMSLF